MFFVNESGIDPIFAALFGTLERALNPHFLLEQVFFKIAESSALPAYIKHWAGRGVSDRLSIVRRLLFFAFFFLVLTGTRFLCGHLIDAATSGSGTVLSRAARN